MYFLLLSLIPVCLAKQVCQVELSRSKLLCVSNGKGVFYPIERQIQEGVNYEIPLGQCLLMTHSLDTGPWAVTSEEVQLEYLRGGRSARKECSPTTTVKLNGHTYRKKMEILRMKFKVISIQNDPAVDSNKDNISDYISIDLCIILFCSILLILGIVISIRTIHILN